MSRLEERYRTLLRLLPAGYRQEWEDDMVAAFLESMDTGDPETTAYLADYGRPSLSEAASIVSLAVRLRLGADASPRSRRWGQAVRLATLMAMLTHAVLVTGGVAVALWYSGKLAWLPTPAPELMLTGPASIWSTTWDLAGTPGCRPMSRSSSDTDVWPRRSPCSPSRPPPSPPPWHKPSATYR